MDKAAPSMLKATLIGGGAAGIAAGLPVIGFLNCLCCSLVLGGGFLAAYLYSRDCRIAGAAFRPGGGAMVGLVAGLFYAVAGTLVSVLVRLVIPINIEEVTSLLDRFDLPPETYDAIVEFAQKSQSAIGILLAFCATLLLAAVFSTIGGLIGGAVFKVESPPGQGTGLPPEVPPAGV